MPLRACHLSNLWRPVPGPRSEELLRHPISIDGPFKPKSLVAGQRSRKVEDPLLGVRQPAASRGHDPADVGPAPLPLREGDGHDVRGEHGMDVIEDGLDADAQAAVGVVLVHLVAGALLEGGDEGLDIQHCDVWDAVQGGWTVVDERD